MEFILDEKVLTLNNPKLKGYIGANILSQINDYKNSLNIDTSKPNQRELLKLCNSLGIDMSDFSSEDETIKKEVSDKIQAEVLKDSSLIISIFGQSGDYKILFEIIKDILEYYSIDSSISADDFTKSDILDVIKWLKSEPKNEIQDFLGLSGQKHDKKATNLV